MSRRSPLLDLHRQGGGLVTSYGTADSPDSVPLLVEAFDPVPIEYAAIRSHAAIFDQPHRATLSFTGPDRLEFLNRMVTQELKGFAPHSMRRSFWLSRKGRIDGDLRLINLPDRLLIDVDVHALHRTLAGLTSYIISEDCAIEDQTEAWHRLSLHGPAAAAILARNAEQIAGAPIADIQPGQVSLVRLADVPGVEVVVDRQDSAGEIGLELLVRSENAARIYEALSTPWSARDNAHATPTTPLARRIGWHALNIARIEAGTPLYLVDFGPDSLPHETGAQTLNDRVSFKKGCYLGQEIVARMNALGHPKQRLVGMRIVVPVGSPNGANAADGVHAADVPQAVTGTPVVGGEGADSPVVGAVTSSCVSPMLGQAHVALAMVKWSHAQEGMAVWVRIGERSFGANVAESLKFVHR